MHISLVSFFLPSCFSPLFSIPSSLSPSVPPTFPLPPLLSLLLLVLFSFIKATYSQQRTLHPLTRHSSSLPTVDMVDTQQLLAWPVGFSLSAVDLSELDDSSHSLDMKHLSTLDYASISSASIPSSLSPSLVSSISSVGVAYDPSPPQSEEPLTNMDYTNMHSYRTELNTHSKSGLFDGLTRAESTFSLALLTVSVCGWW